MLGEVDRRRERGIERLAVGEQVRGDEVLQGEGHAVYVKTSGKTGLHLLVPWKQEGRYDAARFWASGIAGQVTAALPETATSDIRKPKRGRHSNGADPVTLSINAIGAAAAG